MTYDDAIQELAGMYNVVATDSLDATLRAEKKNSAIDMAIAALKTMKAQSDGEVEPRPADLDPEVIEWLNDKSPSDAMGTIANICIDWDGYRTFDGLGLLVNEIWAYARHWAKQFYDNE